MRPVLTLTAATPVYEALGTMRESRNHLAVVVDDAGFRGVLTINDVLTKLMPTPAASA